MSSKSVPLKNVAFFIILNVLSWLFVSYVWKDENTVLLDTKNLVTTVITLCIMIVLIINSYLLANIRGFHIFKSKVKEII